VCSSRVHCCERPLGAHDLTVGPTFTPSGHNCKGCAATKCWIPAAAESGAMISSLVGVIERSHFVRSLLAGRATGLRSINVLAQKCVRYAVCFCALTGRHQFVSVQAFQHAHHGDGPRSAGRSCIDSRIPRYFCGTRVILPTSALNHAPHVMIIAHSRIHVLDPSPHRLHGSCIRVFAYLHEPVICLEWIQEACRGAVGAFLRQPQG
jgi:hypothetical protein